jgi:hypothetical protein
LEDEWRNMAVELSSFCSCTEIHECISSEVVSKNIELCGPREEIDITRFIWIVADVQRVKAEGGVEGWSGVHD